MDDKIRLQKYLSMSGLTSRRKAEELIIKGLVKVNGRVAKLGDKVDPKKDLVSVRDKKVQKVREKHVYIMLNKPRGYVTTMSDEQGRKCVASLVKDINTRVYPIGRLDRNSEGLLLFTNDGDFANAMMHPSNRVSKTYRVTIRPSITPEQIAHLSEGIVLDGKKTLPAGVRVISEEKDRVVLEIILYEGRNRQIRRMLESLDLTTVRLRRVAYGKLKLAMLEPSKWRHLTKDEVKYLRRISGVEKKF